MTRQTLVIGDIQGCYQGMKRVLKKANFNADKDKLYAVGDLVARGEDSLSTLQYLFNLGDSFSSVLGNHDLHLLAITQGLAKAKSADHLSKLLRSKQLSELTHWLRQFPLAQKLPNDHLLVHAGLYPLWSSKKLIKLSQEVSDVLRGDDWVSLLRTMYGNKPDVWSKELNGADRLRFIVNACTRMRFIYSDGKLDFDSKSSPANASKDLIPWFKLPNNKLKKSETVVFGHWAALEGKTNNAQFIGLDTGYVWGNSMTVIRLEDRQLFSVSRR